LNGVILPHPEALDKILGSLSKDSGISPPTYAGDTDLLRIPLEILEGVGGVNKY
jgi:hypothetical protein